MTKVRGFDMPFYASCHHSCREYVGVCTMNTLGPSIYYVSKGLGRWVGGSVYKIARFAEVQYCIYADLIS